MKCSRFGFDSIAPGTKHECPNCGASVIALLRDGRGFVPRHEIKRAIVRWSYKNCTKGAV